MSTESTMNSRSRRTFDGCFCLFMAGAFLLVVAIGVTMLVDVIGLDASAYQRYVISSEDLESAMAPPTGVVRMTVRIGNGKTTWVTLEPKDYVRFRDEGKRLVIVVRHGRIRTETVSKQWE